ncbi:HlyD family secretion protein [Pedobacter cryoconitis]|uniref:HlyD family secretion protein n=1 Tax=Pedobacter cryoconitis TaxID=188932 RepID=A0A7X0J1F1_9SPHI|nr:efflux RND transporter periplasmic adaptor subunit [Pedobacter cryoconitis]MBB6499170.1 HlyD family secretion protein [Pedobacter cryoconitis]
MNNPTKILLPLSMIFFCVTSCSQKKLDNAFEGKIKRETIAFTTKMAGRILKIYVKEGDLVHRGDTLAMLSLPEVTAKVAQAHGVVKAASAQHTMADNGATKNQLKQLQAKYHASSEQFAFAQKSFKRASAMYADSMMAPQAYDEAYAKFQGAKAQLDATTAELNEAKKGVRYETKDATLGQQQQAAGVLQEAEVAYSERYIIATNDMAVETITLHEGELATPGYAIFSGYIPNSTWFRFTVPESQIAQVKKGSSVTVKVPYSEEAFNGKIVTIKQMPKYADITTAYPEYKMDEAVYEIKIIPEDTKKAEGLLYNAAVLLPRSVGTSK